MIILHDCEPSGNSYKIRLLLHHLEIPFLSKEYDVTKGETRTEDFLKNINPNGRIPVVQLENGKYLAESNAIIYYFAQDTDYFPKDTFEKAEVIQWMAFEQYSHEPYIAVAKFILTMLPKQSERRYELPLLHKKGYEALDVMELQLKQTDYLVGNKYSIADICLFAYTHKAHMGDFHLSRYPAIGEWIERIKSCPSFVPMFKADVKNWQIAKI